jgi:hypothetical protein
MAILSSPYTGMQRPFELGHSRRRQKIGGCAEVNDRGAQLARPIGDQGDVIAQKQR